MRSASIRQAIRENRSFDFRSNAQLLSLQANGQKCGSFKMIWKMNWKFCEITLSLIELMITKPLKHLCTDGVPIPNTAMSIGNWPQQQFSFANLIVYQPMMELRQ